MDDLCQCATEDGVGTVFSTVAHAIVPSISCYCKIPQNLELREQVCLVALPKEMYSGEQPSLKFELKTGLERYL